MTAMAETPKAGRELDALIAEQVMGWTITTPIDPACDHAVGTHRNGKSAKRNFGLAPGADRDDVIPNYSRDIASAFLVVEEMERRGHMVLLGRFTAAPPGATAEECALTWRATFMRGGDGDQWANSAPHAICLAALAAVAAPVSRGETP
jgi:hypothetical protein